jgi:ubiquinone/menaquinone biosynthesis C-methylase UbiE
MKSEMHLGGQQGTAVSFRNYGASAPENYEKYFVPAIGLQFASDLLEVAALRPGERVLDVACGTGVATRLAMKHVGPGGRIAGLDVNPGMLAVARSVTPPDTSIEWYEGTAESIPLPDGSFDAVLCSLGMQFVPDKPAALREMHRVLAPGGRIVMNGVGPTPPPLAILGRALAEHVNPQAGGFVEQVFSLHDQRELEALVTAAGFRKVAVESDGTRIALPSPVDFLWQYVNSTPLVGALQQVDDEGRLALERDVLAGWQQFVKDGALILEVDVVTVTGRKR